MSIASVTEQLFYAVAVLNILGWLFLLTLLVAAITKPRFWKPFRHMLERFAARISLAVALIATFGSLWLSEIALYTPCKLCWWQRIFMYPLVIIFGISLARSIRVRLITLWMTTIGGLIALYHYGVQRLAFLQNTVPCTVDASCATTYLGYWGFYSIPLMAFTAFTIIFVVQLFFGRKH